MAEAPEAAGYGIAVWSSAAWRAQALAWVDARLAEHGARRTGEVEQPHLRPWATALRIPTTRGVYWLKAPGPGTGFEVPLYACLARVAPQRILTPLALDLERRWVLLPDGGPTLGDSLEGEARLLGLERALAEYGQLQRELMPHGEQLLAAGLVDMRPERMPERFDQAAAVAEAYVSRQGNAEDRALLTRALGCRERFVAQCRELSSAPIASSLDHNDMHPWNIFVPSGDAPARFYDYGDSVLAHPFASLLIALGFLLHGHEAEPARAPTGRVRDAYLSAFADLLPHADLVHLAELACHVGKPARALVWQRGIAAMTPEEASSFARAPLRWFCAVLDPSPIISGG